MWSERDEIEGFFSPSDPLNLHWRNHLAHLKQRSKLSCGRKNFYVLVGMSYLRTQTNVPLVIHFTFTAIVCFAFFNYNLYQTQGWFRKGWDKSWIRSRLWFFSIIVHPWKTNLLLWDLKLLDHFSHWPFSTGSKIEHMSRIFISQHIISVLALGSRDLNVSILNIFCFLQSAECFSIFRSSAYCQLHSHLLWSRRNKTERTLDYVFSFPLSSCDAFFAHLKG